MQKVKILLKQVKKKLLKCSLSLFSSFLQGKMQKPSLFPLVMPIDCIIEKIYKEQP